MGTAQQLHTSVSHGADGHHHSDAHAHHHSAGENTLLGFWIYLMSDCLLFAGLFATYAVLSHATAGGPSGKQLFELPYVLVETFILLFSSLGFGFASIAAHKGNLKGFYTWLAITALLGLSFIGMELNEFHHLISEGAGPDRSAFLSSFFFLVGTHGLHVTCGLIWMLVLAIQINQQGLVERMKTRLDCLSLFWHFLDIIWIGVFTVVYLLGVL